MSERRGSGIGSLGEGLLHAQLKTWYAQPGDAIEEAVDGFVIDIVRGEQLIEIQTGNFTALKRKLARLLPAHPVRVIHPIALNRWIVRRTVDGEMVGRRKSPRRGRMEDAFYELVRIPHLLGDPNLVVELVGIEDEELRVKDGGGSWRRKGWSIQDRRLLTVVTQIALADPDDYLGFLPLNLPLLFTNRDLAEALGCRISLAQKMTYTLREMNLLVHVGKTGNAHLFEKLG